MKTLPRCRFPGCHQHGHAVLLPFSERVVLLCARHCGWAVLARMREVVA